MDYDHTNIAAVYDRGRDHGPEVLRLWMHAVEAHLDRAPGNILDLGCGTGRFTECLAAHFNAEVIGIDPSIKMLEQARQKQRDDRVQYGRGRAEAIPLAPQSVDLIFISMSFHHFSDPALATRECRRILREGGSVFVRTATREQSPAYPYVPFFPASRALLEALLPPCDRVCTFFEAAGFRTVASELITQTIAPSWIAYAEKLGAGSDSVLARLSAADMEAGLAALRAHAACAPDQAVTESIDFLVFR
jgi:ubiquinone/menaquinone biosynthesis C-methylase UbiE